MADQGGKKTIIDPYRLGYAYQTGPFGYTPGIVTGEPQDWFGPLNPMAPAAPPEVAGRQFDFPVGYNVNPEPRPYEPVKFADLRALADAYDVLRTIIETRKDQMSKLDWTIKPRTLANGKPATGLDDPLIVEIAEFFTVPDGENFWDAWLRQVLEDLFVIDAPTLYVQRDRRGKLLKLEQIDGATISRIIDDYGRTPTYPVPAYQQNLHGLPAVNYTTRDLIYRPRNRRVHKVYGYSPVEQIMMTINIALRRQIFLLQYYTEGNVPESLVGVPDNWSTKQIAEFQAWFDSVLAGETGQRRRMRFMPGGIGKTFIDPKSGALTDATDEWLTRICCYAFSISPQAFLHQMNRATAQTAKETAAEEGLAAVQLWVKALIDYLILTEWGTRKVEFKWAYSDDIDEKQRAEILTSYVKSGILAVNEARNRIGEEPVTGGEQPKALLAAGWMPVDPAQLPELLNPNGQGGIAGSGAGNPAVSAAPPAKEKPPVSKGVAKAADDPLADPPEPDEVAPADWLGGVAPLARALSEVLGAVWTRLAPEITRLLELRDDVTVADVPGEIDKALDLGGLAAAVAPTQQALAAAGSAAVSEMAGPFRVEIGTALFDRVEQAAVDYAAARAAEMVGMRRINTGELIANPDAAMRIDETTRALIRRTVTEGLADGDGNALITEKIGRLGFGAERAELIAMTEIGNAASQAALASLRADAAAGVNVRKRWSTANDGKVDPDICLRNAADGAIPLDQAFSSGHMAPLGHPRCRCRLVGVVLRASAPSNT